MFQCSSDFADRTVCWRIWFTNGDGLALLPALAHFFASPHPLPENHWNIGTDVKFRAQLVKEQPHGNNFSMTYETPKKSIYQVRAKSRSIS
jgi:hypothetical protein